MNVLETGRNTGRAAQVMVFQLLRVRRIYRNLEVSLFIDTTIMLMIYA